MMAIRVEIYLIHHEFEIAYKLSFIKILGDRRQILANFKTTNNVKFTRD